MKVLVLADIHGSVYYAEKALAIFEEEGASHMIILGDILSCGGWLRPVGYDPASAAKLLNEYSGKIIAVRGNCDSEEDAAALDFPAAALYSWVLCGARRFFLTHGHVYSRDNLPGMCRGDVFLQGHTHSAFIERADGVHLLNPGSVSLPKNDAPHSFGMLEDGGFRVMGLDGGLLGEVRFGE